jgi:hypothetical protein
VPGKAPEWLAINPVSLANDNSSGGSNSGSSGGYAVTVEVSATLLLLTDIGYKTVRTHFGDCCRQQMLQQR